MILSFMLYGTVIGAFAAAGGHAPEARAEVGAAEHRVEGHADPQDAGDGIRRAHVASPGTAGGSSPDGPYGTSASSSAPASRQRRAIVLRVITVAAPSTV